MKRLRLAVPAVLLLGLLGLPGLPGLAPTGAAAAPPTAGQATYVPLEPVRLLDTRRAGGAPVGPGGTVDLVVADGVRVPLDATAVVLNVTATAATGGTDVRVYPKPASGSPVPTVSNVNLGRGATVANLVHVAVGADRSVRLRNAAGSVHLIADLSGYFRQGAGGTSYEGAAPRRLLDTRDTDRPLAAGEVRTLRVRGTAAGAPAGASAVVLNVTAVGATRQTDIRVWPTRSGDPPTVSNLNPAPGSETPAAVVVAVGDGDSVSIRSSGGSVHVVVDLSGWYVPGEPGDVPAGAFHAVAPHRLLDTRSTSAVGPGEARPLTVAGAGVVPAPGTAVVLNVTATGATAGTNIRVYPKTPGGAVPRASNVNVRAGRTLANTVVAQVGADGQVLLRNAAGSVHLVVDLAGWFAPAGDGWDVSWPQCTTAGSTTSNLPDGGAFTVVGVTRGRPFTENECFAAQWSWATSLPGEASVYLNTDAPGAEHARWDDPGPRACSGASSDSGCAYNYGWALAEYALARMRPTASGGRPFVWLDIENGPTWQTFLTNDNAVAVNRGVINGAAARLREARHRYGLYAERTSAGRDNDFVQIMGEWKLPLPVWVYRATQPDPTPQCAPEESITGGPIHMVQIQPDQSGQPYDVNHLC